MVKVRLSKEQIKAIKDTIKSLAGKNVNIYIFGSRVDLTKKGGDIDIIVKLNESISEKEKFNLKMKIVSSLYKKIGERKIDLLLIDGKPKKEIEKIALETGIRI